MREEERQALEALMAEEPTITALAQREEEKARQGAAGKAPGRLAFYSAASLYGREIARPPIIISGLIPAGLTVLAGAPKRGKSWMALRMALCVAAGEPFLGMHAVKGAVLYLDLESREYRVQDRLKQLLVGPAPQNLYFAHESSRLNGGLMEQLQGWIACAEHPAMIVIDTLGRVKSGSRKGENAYESDTRLFGGLQSFALKNRLAVVVVHHLRKDSGVGDDYLERISGSMGLTGVCDAVLALTGGRGEETSILKTGSRDFEAQDFVVRFNGGAWELVSCNSESYQEEQAYRSSAVVRGVLAVAEACGQWQGTVSELQLMACELSDAPLAALRANEFGRELQRFIQPLREKSGVRIGMHRAGKNRRRVLTVEKEEQRQTSLLPGEEIPF